MKLHAPNRWFVFGPICCAVVPLICIPTLQWLAVSKHGSGSFLDLELLFMLAAAAAFFGIVPALVGLAFKKTRRFSALIAVCSIIFLPVFVWSLRMGERIRMHEFKQLAERSRPLINAIRAFELKNNHPPESLQQIVPEFISAIPSTGIGAYPEFCYFANATNWNGNPWVLTVFTPSGGINFDQFMYFPLTNYPAKGYGGWLERVGDWAYVHE